MTREKLFLNLWTSLRWSNTSGNNVNTFMNINRFQRASTNAYSYQLSEQTRLKIESFLLTSWGGILCRPHFNHPSTPSSCCSAHHRRDCLKNSLNFANINLSLPPTHTLQQQHHDDDNYNFALHMHLLLPLMR